MLDNCVIKSIMKKILIGCLILITACRPAADAPTPAPALFPTSTPAPTLQPATPTLAPTSTPEPSPTPFPRSFTNEFDSGITGWVLLQAGNDSVPSFKSENSSLALQMDSPFTWVYVLYGPHDYADVRIDAQFINRGGSPASIGLICRYGESEGWFEYNVSTDGSYNVLYGDWLAAGIAEYLPILSGSSKLIQPSGTSQEAGLTCSGTTLELYVDQQLIRRVDVTRYELTEGKIGLTASSFENTPVSAAFDWVRVSAP